MVKALKFTKLFCESKLALDYPKHNAKLTVSSKKSNTFTSAAKILLMLLKNFRKLKGNAVKAPTSLVKIGEAKGATVHHKLHSSPQEKFTFWKLEVSIV